MKPGKTFNLSKDSKRLLATITDKQLRGSIKKMFIEAELYEAVVPKTTKRERPGANYNTTATSATPAAE
ncbi:hypothetical protein UFOVP181_158 [uncultured Caudovirales phage]|uniref:Uncharacterized protein n=1 Tax=uncultured Caudovirales phage TaxID=2100421 RepID=A0A6J5KQC0_9CAUD|nr:hypothetical protein UFOVP57_4 [uncultured Caudovirales phage]CAB5208769.1 hypothetical protein UFOVP181_158 [uncultured Caudovirales phage]